MNSWPPGWRPPPWCWPPPCAAWATFPGGCFADFYPVSPEILKKVSSNDQLQFPVQCHLKVIFWIFGRNNKQTNLLPPLIQFLLSFHCGFTNSHWCWGVRMSTFLWAVYQLGMLHKLHFSGCQLWGRISFVQLWRLGKSSTTFRCTLLKTSKYKEDFLCLLTPPQTFTGVPVNWSRISFVQECQY